MKRIVEFINYIFKQNDNKNLKFVGIHHEISNKIQRRIKKYATLNKRKRLFTVTGCTKQSSLDLCKLIIKLLTENVESIDILIRLH